jgi:hypothetical protein
MVNCYDESLCDRLRAELVSILNSTTLPIGLEWQQVHARGLSVGFGEDSAMTPLTATGGFTL